MKTWKTAYAILVMALLTASFASGQASLASHFVYTLNDEGTGVVITGYQKDAPGGAVVIPGEIEGYPVVAIRLHLYSNFKESSLSYTDNRYQWLTDAAVKAKGLRPYITSIVFPESITEIINADGNSTTGIIGPKVKSISFPKNLKKIRKSCFSARDDLRVIKWPENPEWLKEMETNILATGGVTELVIPEGVITIGDEVFRGNENLTKVTIPESVQYIGENAFSSCSALTTVVMPSHAIEYSVHSYYNKVFANCPKLNLASQGAIRKTGYTGSF